MATIHRRGARWRVQVRRRGLPPLSKTFGKHEDAARWTQTVEGRLAVGDILDLGEPGGRPSGKRWSAIWLR